MAFGLQNGQNFCYLGAHAKIWNPMTTPAGVLAFAVTRKQEEEEEEKENLQHGRGNRRSISAPTHGFGPS